MLGTAVRVCSAATSTDDGEAHRQLLAASLQVRSYCCYFSDNILSSVCSTSIDLLTITIKDCRLSNIKHNRCLQKIRTAWSLNCVTTGLR